MELSGLSVWTSGDLGTIRTDVGSIRWLKKHDACLLPHEVNAAAEKAIIPTTAANRILRAALRSSHCSPTASFHQVRIIMFLWI